MWEEEHGSALPSKKSKKSKKKSGGAGNRTVVAPVAVKVATVSPASKRVKTDPALAGIIGDLGIPAEKDSASTWAIFFLFFRQRFFRPLVGLFFFVLKL